MSSGAAAADSTGTPHAGYIASSDAAFTYKPACGRHFLRKFDLYETGKHFYIVGRDPRRHSIRLLTIDRSPHEIREGQCVKLVNLVHEDFSQYAPVPGVFV